MLEGIAFIAIVLGCLVGVPLMALAYVIAIPFALIEMLCSAIWVGEIPPLAGLPRVVARLAGPDLKDDPSTARQREGAARDGPGRVRKRSTQLGWRSHPDRDVAVRSYYFGQVADDLLDSWHVTVSFYGALARAARHQADRAAGSDIAIINIVIPVSIKVGAPIGVTLGSVAVICLGSIYVVACVLSVVVAMSVAFVLRMADEASCLIARDCTNLLDLWRQGAAKASLRLSRLPETSPGHPARRLWRHSPRMLVRSSIPYDAAGERRNQAPGNMSRMWCMSAGEVRALRGDRDPIVRGTECGKNASYVHDGRGSARMGAGSGWKGDVHRRCSRAPGHNR